MKKKIAGLFMGWEKIYRKLINNTPVIKISQSWQAAVWPFFRTRYLVPGYLSLEYGHIVAARRIIGKFPGHYSSF